MHYNTEHTRLQVELAEKMSDFLKSFNDFYFNKIMNDQMNSDLINLFTEFLNGSPEGAAVKTAQKKFEKFTGKMM